MTQRSGGGRLLVNLGDGMAGAEVTLSLDPAEEDRLLRCIAGAGQALRFGARRRSARELAAPPAPATAPPPRVAPRGPLWMPGQRRWAR